MPGDSYYWNTTDQETDDSFVEKEPYIDPWDLENYAYIREHLDSMELRSSPSLPSGSSGEFAEPTSSFDYVPVRKRSAIAPVMRHLGEERFESIMSDQENYAAIEDLQQTDRKSRRARSEINWPIKKRRQYDYESGIEEESPYAESLIQENSVFGIYDEKGIFRRVALPLSYKPRDRSLSYSYGDSYVEYTSKSIEVDQPNAFEDFHRVKRDAIPPIYDDIGGQRIRKPQNFGFSKYGHLKIDYSCSWNNLNKYMKYN